MSVRVCCPCSDSRCFSASGVCEEIIPEFYLKTAADAVNAALSRSGRSERLPTHAGQTVSPLLVRTHVVREVCRMAWARRPPVHPHV